MTVRSLIFITLVSFAAACGSSDTPEDIDMVRNESSKQMTTIQWIDSSRNFANITDGQKLSVSFRFKNTGANPLVIQSVHPACGCTVADFPKEPIAPGGEGEITGEFDSAGKAGQNHKTITVYTNTVAHTHILEFNVNVIGKPQQQNQAPAN